MGKVVAISISNKKGEKKENIDIGVFVENYGLKGDAHAGSERQVSLLGVESIEKMKNRLPSLSFGDFAENITTEGIKIHTLPVGTRLKIGEKAVFEITQIGKKCHDWCNIKKIVGSCVMPTEGVFAKVLVSGTIIPGDKITVEG